MKSHLCTFAMTAAAAFALSVSAYGGSDPGAGARGDEGGEGKAAPAKGSGGKADPEQIKKEIGEMIAAVFEADMAPIAKHTHEKVFAIVGSKEEFLAAMKKAFGEAKEAGVKLVSSEIGEPEYFAGDVHEFVLVPTTIVMEAAGTVSKNPGHQLGIRKKGEEVWKYVDCSGLTTELARAWFPDFPADRELPKASP